MMPTLPGSRRRCSGQLGSSPARRHEDSSQWPVVSGQWPVTNVYQSVKSEMGRNHSLLATGHFPLATTPEVRMFSLRCVLLLTLPMAALLCMVWANTAAANPQDTDRARQTGRGVHQAVSASRHCGELRLVGRQHDRQGRRLQTQGGSPEQDRCAAVRQEGFCPDQGCQGKGTDRRSRHPASHRRDLPGMPGKAGRSRPAEEADGPEQLGREEVHHLSGRGGRQGIG